MKLILKYLKRYKKLLLFDFLSVFGFALVELGIPTIVAQMIDQGIANQDPQFIKERTLVILLIAVLGVFGTICLGYCSARISINITRDIRSDIFRRVQQFSHAEFNKFGVSSMITRTNNDAFQIQLFVNVLLRTALLTPVMFIVSMVLTIQNSLPLSLVLAASVPFIVAGVYIVAKKADPLSTRQQKGLDKLNQVTRENLTGIRVIRAFRNDEFEMQRFAQTNEDYTNTSRKLFKLMTITQPLFFLMLNAVILIIFWLSANMINVGTLSVGQLTAFLEYCFHAMFSMMLFCTVFIMYPRAAVSASRIQAVFDTDISIVNPENGVTETPIKGKIEFDHVDFVYPNGAEAVLKDISFKAEKGETVAFIGSTGSGKSTLINLIPRFYDVTRGSIRIDDVDIRDFDLKALRSRIGFIPQKALLFSGSIGSNIRFGRLDAPEDEVIHSSQVAQAYDFITQKPHQFEEAIAEGGTNVSGGQKQRLSIARALLIKPEIYIFDDSFSALDFKTDARLRADLKEETKDAITLIVAQRISTIMDADQIIVLNEGKIVGHGTHHELLKNCTIYQEIAASQLSEEELAR